MTLLIVERTARAEEDLIEIWGYVALQNEAAADRLLDGFDRRWELLATQPYSGVARPDIGEDVRYLVVGIPELLSGERRQDCHPARPAWPTQYLA
jgi:toxin ParE1/3/4